MILLEVKRFSNASENSLEIFVPYLKIYFYKDVVNSASPLSH